MNSKKILLNTILIILVIFLGFNLFKRFYFNEFYYRTPDLVGLDYEEATRAIKKSNLNVRDMGEVYSKYPYGKVALQEPIAGATVKKNRNIKIWRSKENPSIFLEDLIGLNYLEAISIAEKNGLIIGDIKKINSTLPINEVIATSPKSGEPVFRGDTISFIISNGL